eukprot:TRINITY_DN15675_c0_g1_i1.p1 TRINITY_DN15675_c0_g1~~TRINITY_DN15675_c0_g1_i1.p1  ORF type:complete len:264 (+),score=33.59 TRINITY_DN15675_c0_g1_i1:101-892(+)
MEEDPMSLWLSDIDGDRYGMGMGAVAASGGSCCPSFIEESLLGDILTHDPCNPCQDWPSSIHAMEEHHSDRVGGTSATKPKPPKPDSAPPIAIPTLSAFLSTPLDGSQHYVDAKLKCMFRVPFERNADLSTAEFFLGSQPHSLPSSIAIARYLVISRKSGEALVPCSYHPRFASSRKNHTEILQDPTIVWDPQNGQLSLQAVLLCKGPCDRRRLDSCFATIQVVCVVLPEASEITLTTHLLHLTCNRSTGRSDRRRGMALRSH